MTDTPGRPALDQVPSDGGSGAQYVLAEHRWLATELTDDAENQRPLAAYALSLTGSSMSYLAGLVDSWAARVAPEFFDELAHWTEKCVRLSLTQLKGETDLVLAKRLRHNSRRVAAAWNKVLLRAETTHPVVSPSPSPANKEEPLLHTDPRSKENADGQLPSPGVFHSKIRSRRIADEILADINYVLLDSSLYRPLVALGLQVCAGRAGTWLPHGDKTVLAEARIATIGLLGKLPKPCRALFPGLGKLIMFGDRFCERDHGWTGWTVSNNDGSCVVITTARGKSLALSMPEAWPHHNLALLKTPEVVASFSDPLLNPLFPGNPERIRSKVLDVVLGAMRAEGAIGPRFDEHGYEGVLRHLVALLPRALRSAAQPWIPGSKVARGHLDNHKRGL